MQSSVAVVVAVIVAMAMSMRGDIPNSRTSGNTDSFQEPALSKCFLPLTQCRQVSEAVCNLFVIRTLPHVPRSAEAGWWWAATRSKMCFQLFQPRHSTSTSHLILNLLQAESPAFEVQGSCHHSWHILPYAWIYTFHNPILPLTLLQ